MRTSIWPSITVISSLKTIVGQVRPEMDLAPRKADLLGLQVGLRGEAFHG
jgi:hypothetical protein